MLNRLQITLDCVQKGFCALYLLGNITLGNHIEIVVIAVGPQIVCGGDNIRQFGIQSSGFDIPSPKLRNNTAMMLHVDLVHGEARIA